MHKVNNLISLMMFLGLTLSGCSVQEKKEEDKRSDTSGATTKPVAKDKGRLGLKMPKQDKVPYSVLEITLEQSYGCAEPYPMPEPRPIEEEYAEAEGTDEAVAADSAALHEARDSDMEYKDVGHPCDSGMTQSYSQTFKYFEDGTVTIDDIVPGSYQIHVRLLGEAGEALEEGYGWAEVAPGIVTEAYVEIYPTSGNGRLDIQIVRGGDRIDYDYDHDDLCGPSAFQDENGKTRWATCSFEGNDGGETQDDAPVASDATASAQ